MMSPESPKLIISSAPLLWKRKLDLSPEPPKKPLLEVNLLSLMRLDEVRFTETGPLNV